MKTKILLLVVAMPLSILDSRFSTALAQGSLAPPGAPAPTMKSLDQIEPRTPISSAPITISAPGSYYLTTNLSVSTNDAIIISSSQVTLDLNGFTISSTCPVSSGNGIYLNQSHGNTNVTILNGHILSGATNNAGVYNGPGFVAGILVQNACHNIRVSNISVIGCSGDGINIGNGVTIADYCTVESTGGFGVAAASIFHCTAELCGNSAINAYATASDCTGISTDTAVAGAGVSASIANTCRGVNLSSGSGINVTDIATACYGQSVSGSGITAYIANSCRVGGGTTNITFKFNMP